MYIIYGILALNLLIGFHELGHFLAAKITKIPVHTYAIGMGPTLLKKEIGETTYKLNLFLIGGYISIGKKTVLDKKEFQDKVLFKEAKSLEEKENRESFEKQSFLKRFTVLVMGCLFNFAMAIFFFSIVVSLRGNLTEGLFINNAETTSIFYDTFKKDDLIVEINDISIDTEFILNARTNSDYINEVFHLTSPITISYYRDDFLVKETFLTDLKSKSIGIEVTLGNSYIKKDRNIIINVSEEIQDSIKMITATFNGLKNKQASVKDFMSVVSIVNYTGKVAQEDFITFLWLMALLSINLGVVNLFPIPALDGGQILFLFIEKLVVLFFPMKLIHYNKLTNYLNTIFLIALLSFSFYILYLDVLRYV